jgi:hypothetical protein
MRVKTLGIGVYAVQTIALIAKTNVSGGKFTLIVGLADNAVK